MYNYSTQMSQVCKHSLSSSKIHDANTQQVNSAYKAPAKSQPFLQKGPRIPQLLPFCLLKRNISMLSLLVADHTIASARRVRQRCAATFFRDADNYPRNHSTIISIAAQITYPPGFQRGRNDPDIGCQVRVMGKC